MKVFLILIVSIILTSCELHEQEGSIHGKPQGQVAQLTGPDVLFEKIGSYDYFGMQEELKTGAYDVNSQNIRGELLLNESIKQGRDLLATLLVGFGAGPAMADAQNQSAFDLIENLADKEEWENILNGNELSEDFLNKKLLEIVNRAAPDTQQATINLMKIYLQNGANINAADQRGFPLLITAANNNLPAVVTFISQQESVSFTHEFRGKQVAIVDTLEKFARRNPHIVQMIEIIKAYSEYLNG